MTKELPILLIKTTNLFALSRKTFVNALSNELKLTCTGTNDDPVYL